MTEIKDITPFVTEQRAFATGDFTDLIVPFERVVAFDDADLVANIGLDIFS